MLKMGLSPASKLLHAVSSRSALSKRTARASAQTCMPTQYFPSKAPFAYPQPFQLTRNTKQLRSLLNQTGSIVRPRAVTSFKPPSKHPILRLQAYATAEHRHSPLSPRPGTGKWVCRFCRSSGTSSRLGRGVCVGRGHAPGLDTRRKQDKVLGAKNSVNS